MNLVGGYSFQEDNWDGLGAQGEEPLSDYVMSNNLGVLNNVNVGDIYSYKGSSRLISFFGRAVYNYGPCLLRDAFFYKCRIRYKSVLLRRFYEFRLRPGEPHPYRKIWLDLARETMVDLAREIGKAVHAVSPSTRVGLMSSTPEVHCAEARDWEGVLNGFVAEMERPLEQMADGRF